LHADERDCAGVLVAVTGAVAEPHAERRQARDRDDVAAPRELSTVIVVGRLDGVDDTREIVASGDRVVAVVAVSVQREHAGALAARVSRRKQVERQRRMTVGGECEFFAGVVGELDSMMPRRRPVARWRVRAEQLTQLRSELRLPLAALIGGGPAELHRERRALGERAEVVVDGL